MTDDEIRALFAETFINPDDAGMPIDRETGEDNYFWTASRVETEDALQEIAADADAEQLARIASDLNNAYPAWARRSDL